MRGVVLIGGRSRRMGHPKALIELPSGRRLLDHIVEVMATVSDEVVLVGSGPITESARALPRLEDAPGLRGPLAGLVSASLLGGPFVVAPCDAAALRSEALQWLCEQRSDAACAVIPHVAGHTQPLIALYEGRAHPILKAHAAQRLAPRWLAERKDVLSPTPPVALADAWLNVNTPEELARLEAAAR